MAILDDVTPLLITYNEIENIERTLAKLDWARRIVVVDSGSSDGTLAFLKSDSRIEIFHRAFTSFAEQCNYGLSLIGSEWVLSMDADYELGSELIDGLRELTPSASDAGFRANFVYRVFGRPLRGTLYPPRIVLYRVRGAQYENQGHGHRVRVPGSISSLRGVIYHDDRKPLSRWFASQLRYGPIEASHLLEANPGELSFNDRVRRRGWMAPVLVFVYVLIVKRALLDGRAGIYYAFQRLLAELVISLEILDRRLSRLR